MTNGKSEKIALFSPKLFGIRQWLSLTEPLLSALNEKYDVHLFTRDGSEGSYPYHEFTWRNLKEPYSLNIYNLGSGEDYSYMLPFVLTKPGWVILRSGSYTNDIWRMHTLDGSEADFLEEMKFSYGKNGNMLGHLLWRGLWGDPLERNYPSLRLISSGSIMTSFFDEWIYKKTVSESGTERLNILPVPFLNKEILGIKKESEAPVFLTIYNDQYPLMLKEIASTSKILIDEVDFKLFIITDTGSKAEVEKIIENYDIKGFTDIFIPEKNNEIESIFVSSDIFLFLEDPLLMTEGLPLYQSIKYGNIIALSETSERLSYPEEIFRRFRYLDSKKGLLNLMRETLNDYKIRDVVREKAESWFHENMKSRINSKIVSNTLKDADIFKTAIQDSAKEAMLQKSEWKLPVNYPEHLYNFKSRLYNSILEKFSGLPKDSITEKFIKEIVG